MAPAGSRKLIFLFPLVLLLEAGDIAPNGWTELYAQALRQFNRGDFDSVAKLAEPAWHSWTATPDSPWHWKFKLLLAESRLEQDRLSDAMPLLDTAAPSPEWEAR